MCFGIIILIIVTVGGIWAYAYFVSAAAKSGRIEWAKRLDGIALPELENMLSDLETKRISLRKDRLLLSGPKRYNVDGELAEANERIKILEAFIAERKSLI